jgi:hypothetical protein
MSRAWNFYIRIPNPPLAPYPVKPVDNWISSRRLSPIGRREKNMIANFSISLFASESDIFKPVFLRAIFP